MKIKRKIIEIDEERCDGCGQCVPSCAEGALRVIDGKARMISDKFCDGLGACIGQCPTGALQLIERETEEFDEEAVMAHLSSIEKTKGDPAPPAFTGCPSTRMENFTRSNPSGIARMRTAAASALSHWPIKIRLVPSDAPFLRGADLLILADCGAVAFADLHREFIQDKVVMMGCPKFDEAPVYIEKFTDIFRTAGIRRITVVRMEVPCCSGLTGIVKKAAALAEAAIPIEEVVLTTRGGILM